MIFHHDGIACENIEVEQKFYENFGFKKEGDIFEDHNLGIRGVFIKKGMMCLELLEPLGDHSPLKSFLQRGIKIYQQAFLVDDLKNTIEKFSVKENWLLISGPQPAIAFGGKEVAFFLSHDRVIEFIQS